jgi:hypothetical protein
VVALHSPEAAVFSGRTLEETLPWCLVSLMAQETGHPQGLDQEPEFGVGPCVV